MQVPKFQLQKVYANGKSEKPELHELHGLDLNCRMGRRGFLLTSALGAGAVAALSGCVAGLDATPAPPPPAINFAETGATPQYVEGARAHRERVNHVAFAPNGKLLISAQASQGQPNTSFKIWAMPSGKLLHTVDAKKKLSSFSFSPDGKKLYAGLVDGIAVWDEPFTGSPKYLANTDSEVDHVAVSPNGKFLANAFSGFAQIRSLPDAKELHKAGRGFVRLAFSPNSSTLAACGMGTETVAISTTSGKVIHKFTSKTMGAAPTADSQNILICFTGILQLWSLSTGKLISAKTISKNTREYGPLAVSPNGKWVVCAITGSNGNRAVILNPPFTEAGPFLALPTLGYITALAVSHNSKTIAAGDSNGNIYIWQVTENGKTVTPLLTLFDPAETPKNVSVRQGTTGQGSTYIGSCGDPLPKGAVCTCNCVPGTYSPTPVTRGQTICTCNTVPTGTYHCTCNKICTCVPIK